MIHLGFVSLMHANAKSTIDNLLVEVDWPNATSCRSIRNIRLNNLRRPLIELCIMTYIVEHELTLGVAPTLVI